MTTVDVGAEFHVRLANRNKLQGDGTFTAEEFRARFLSNLLSPSDWLDDSQQIVLDFASVKRIGPSFANEAFAYFCQFAKPERILKKIHFDNIDEVDEQVIKKELSTGYKKT